MWTSRPSGPKFWVKSLDKDAKSAVISAAPISPPGMSAPPAQTRGPGQIVFPPGSSPKDPRAFFQGTYRLPSAGRWRLTVTIGDASGCFLVTAD